MVLLLFVTAFSDLDRIDSFHPFFMAKLRFENQKTAKTKSKFRF